LELRHHHKIAQVPGGGPTKKHKRKKKGKYTNSPENKEIGTSFHRYQVGLYEKNEDNRGGEWNGGERKKHTFSNSKKREKGGKKGEKFSVASREIGKAEREAVPA